MKLYTFTIDGESFKGSKDQLIKSLAGAGYAALRNEKNPHVFWQYEQYLKSGGKDQK